MREREKQIHIRLTSEEHRNLRTVAARMGKTIQQLVWERIFNSVFRNVGRR
jgi:predicted HicB family RNase H-like nuclease